MNIKYTGKYKSISDFEWNDIPLFSVITGPNGVGKSQLLQLIENAYAKRIKDLGMVTFEGVYFKASEVSYNISEWHLTNTSHTSTSEIQSEIKSRFESYRNPNRHLDPNNPRMFAEFDKIDKKLNKPRHQVTIDEFSNHYSLDFVEHDSQMSVQIGKIFLDYWLSLLQSRAEQRDEGHFRSINGEKPWVVLSEIFHESKLPFKFNNPEQENVSFKGFFHFKISDKVTNEEIPFQDLSSGEKVLVSLMFYLYNSQEKNRFPKLLLLDEPDAHLHPSMTVQFLNVIKNVLVDKYSVRVIMTTHSPSTVALAPEDSIFLMERAGKRISKPSSINKAISMLTSGLVFVGKGTKYVLVEDEDDVEFYSVAYNYLISNNSLNADIPIVFIPASTSTKTGGVSVVEDWVKKLNDSGLKSIIQGLIDLDKGNIESEGIKVLKRYSIENYLLDPIIVYAALLDNEKAPPVNELKLKLGDEHKLKKLDVSSLQKISNQIHNIISPYLKNIFQGFDEKENETILVPFESGITLNYPSWLIKRRGKDLLNLYGNTFGSKFINPTQLMKSLKKVYFVPNDLKEIFEQIQNHN